MLPYGKVGHICKKWVTLKKNKILFGKMGHTWKNGSQLENRIPLGKWVTFEKRDPSLKERVKIRKMGHRKSKSGCMGENQES